LKLASPIVRVAVSPTTPEFCQSTVPPSVRRPTLLPVSFGGDEDAAAVDDRLAVTGAGEGGRPRQAQGEPAEVEGRRICEVEGADIAQILAERDEGAGELDLEGRGRDRRPAGDQIVAAGAEGELAGARNRPGEAVVRTVEFDGAGGDDDRAGIDRVDADEAGIVAGGLFQGPGVDKTGRRGAFDDPEIAGDVEGGTLLVVDRGVDPGVVAKHDLAGLARRPGIAQAARAAEQIIRDRDRAVEGEGCVAFGAAAGQGPGAVDRDLAAGGQNTAGLGEAVGEAGGRRDRQGAARHVEEILADGQRVDDEAVATAVGDGQHGGGVDDDVIVAVRKPGAPVGAARAPIRTRRADPFVRRQRHPKVLPQPCCDDAASGAAQYVACRPWRRVAISAGDTRSSDYYACVFLYVAARSAKSVGRTLAYMAIAGASPCCRRWRDRLLAC
jgi:hypothetical protein